MPSSARSASAVFLALVVAMAAGTRGGIRAAAPTGILQFAPQDTTLHLDAANYSGDTVVSTYTWPANRVANAILMKFDLAGLPGGAVVEEATLRLALVESDTTADTSYTVTVHKLLGRNPVIAAATGYTADGVLAWTPNACCQNNVPMAQANISPAYDTLAVDRTLGYKSWTITTMVREWHAAPATNFGLLLNSDTSKLADRYRNFASVEHADPNVRPFLHVTYSPNGGMSPGAPTNLRLVAGSGPALDVTPPTVSLTAPASGATISGAQTVTANASDNVGVTSVQFKLDGLNLQAADTTAPYSVSWNTVATAAGAHTLSAVASDAAGNTRTSGGVTITVDSPTTDTTPPQISAVLASSITASAATITWTTNEASNSQVEYGTTTAYGSLSALNGSLLTAHVTVLNGLTAGRLYHYRVRSRDAAGNLAVSGDSTFTTLAGDAIPPVVAITAPLAGTVSGTVTVSATATDNVGVSGVQFKLDGGNLGAEDTSAPYSVSWNTTTVANGAHAITAVARDAAGNQTTSLAVTVTVSNVPSAMWANEPSGFVVTEETGWESGTLGNWYRIFTSANKPINVSNITNSLIGEAKALQIDYPQGHDGGGGTELRYDIASANRSNEIYVGYYVQVNPQWQGHSSAINKMIYLHDGGGSFSAMWYEIFGSGSSPLDLYVVNQSGSGPAGFHENVNQVTFVRGQWHKVEIYQKQGASNNGIVRVWVDGVLAIDRSDVDTRSTPVDNITISGIWGGVDDIKNQDDYMRFDRIRISRPGS